MNIEKFTIKSQEALQKSAEIAAELEHQAIEPAHMLKALLTTDECQPASSGYEA
jgi:ATP-dependent Clp protease ATP-binding subunit ClpB